MICKVQRWVSLLRLDLVLGAIIKYLCLPFSIFKTASESIIDIDLDHNNKPCWLVLRCSKCDSKVIPMLINATVSPVNKYCKHCGCEEFYFEKKDYIDRLDTIYALYSKDVKEGMVRQCGMTLNKVCATSYLGQSA